MTDRKAYPGSCHCGAVQYQLKLAFPPTLPSKENYNPPDTIRIYKCNCTTCQKMGYFHVRPIDPAEDFILTSPATIEELGDYRVFRKVNGWFFCKSCGVRVFGLGGKWEQVELDVAEWAGTKPPDEPSKTQKVWQVRGVDATWMDEKEGREVTQPVFYLSVNAVTLEPAPETDLRKWHDNGWIFYVENLNEEFRGKYSLEPREGGMY